MKSRQQRIADGPGWFEVICGAILSLLLGAVLSAAFLVFKPVTTVTELPKEPVPGMVYYIEGTRESSKIHDVAAKRKLLAEGASVDLIEDELNTIAMPPVAAPVAKKMELPQPAAPADTFAPGSPNFRIRDGVMQIGVPVELNAFQMNHKVILQTRGNFSSTGEQVLFQPDELYLGSCPLQRLPVVKDYLLKRLATKIKTSDELVAAWSKVGSATIEGSKLHIAAR